MGNSCEEDENSFIPNCDQEGFKEEKRAPTAILDPTGLAQMHYDSDNGHHESSV